MRASLLSVTELPSVLVSLGLLCEKSELFTHLAGGIIRPTKRPVSGQWATKLWGPEHQGTRNAEVSGMKSVRRRGHTCQPACICLHPYTTECPLVTVQNLTQTHFISFRRLQPSPKSNLSSENQNYYHSLRSKDMQLSNRITQKAFKYVSTWLKSKDLGKNTFSEEC